jgi:hypothetical protein
VRIDFTKPLYDCPPTPPVSVPLCTRKIPTDVLLAIAYVVVTQQPGPGEGVVLRRNPIRARKAVAA